MSQQIGNSQLVDTWAAEGPIVEPDITKVDEGWQLGEQPPHEWMNYLQNRFGQKLNHLLANGVAQWNSTDEQPAGCVKIHNGELWLCRNTNTNSEPTVSNSNWMHLATGDVGQNIAVFDSAGVTSWDVPEVLQAGLRKAHVTVTGGGGGASENGATAGSSGQSSSFGTYISVPGAPGGSQNNDASGPQPGAAGAGGDINLPGGGGGAGRSTGSITISSALRGGQGAPSFWGGGARQRAGVTEGAPGSAPGSGASGPANVSLGGLSGGSSSGTSFGLIDLAGVESVQITVGAGGNSGGGSAAIGAPGIVIVRW